VEGGDIKEAVLGEGGEGVRNLVRKASTKLQSGSGKRRRKNFQHKSGIILKPSDVIGKTIPQKSLLKKRRIDTLGYY
jgi:hypothetical protein